MRLRGKRQPHSHKAPVQRVLYQPKNVDVLVSGHQMCVLRGARGCLQLVPRQHPDLQLQQEKGPHCGPQGLRPACRLRRPSFQEHRAELAMCPFHLLKAHSVLPHHRKRLVQGLPDAEQPHLAAANTSVTLSENCGATRFSRHHKPRPLTL